MSSFKNKAKGTFNELKGEAKQKIGKTFDNASLQAEGIKDELKGKAQKKTGEVQQNAKETYEDVKRDAVDKVDELKDRYIDKRDDIR